MSRTSRADGATAVLTEGMLAGLAGGSALNTVTYLDMLVRARPASQTPERSAGRLAHLARVDLGSERQAANRRSGLGPLLGQLTAVATTVAFTLLVRRRRPPVPVATALLGAGAMVASDGPLVALAVTDPRRWSRADWLADAIPHLAYGLAAAVTLDRMRAHRPGRWDGHAAGRMGNRRRSG